MVLESGYLVDMSVLRMVIELVPRSVLRMVMMLVSLMEQDLDKCQ
jgi:hypothetical protein